MVKNTLLIPVVAMVFSVGAFVGMSFLAYQVSPIKNSRSYLTNQDIVNTNQSSNLNVSAEENTNTSLKANTNSPTNENTNTFTDPTKNWRTYTSDTYGFVFRYPSDWKLTENPVIVGPEKFDGVQVSAAGGTEQFSVTAIPFFGGQTDPVEQYIQYSGFLFPVPDRVQSVIAGIHGYEVTSPHMTPSTAAFIDHEDVAFKLDQGTDRATWNAIIRSFTFTDGNVDLESTNPIKKVTDLTRSLDFFGNRISIMGDQALIGSGGDRNSNGHLYYYDGTTVTDLISRVAAADPADADRTYGINYIANNGEYWLVSVCRLFGGNYLYRYDGATWTDLTTHVRAAQKKQGCFGPAMTWNGTEWLLTYNLQLITYDGGTTFTDVALSEEFSQQFIVFPAAWNGSYYLIPTNGSTWKTFKFDGRAFTALPLPSDNHVASAAWNGNYWLLSGVSNQPILKYDGQTITSSKYVSYQQMGSSWLRSIWIVGPYFFDGTTLDKTTPFAVNYRVEGIDIGMKYGLMAGGGRVWRFDF